MKEQDKYAVYEKYSRRVGGTPQERLAWICRLVNESRTQGADWLPGDWDNRRTELAVFSGIGQIFPRSGGLVLENGEIVERPSRNETEAILTRVQQMVDDGEHHRKISLPPFVMKQVIEWDAPAGRYRLSEAWDYENESSWADRVRYTLVRLLETDGHRIQRCPSTLPHKGKRCANYFLKSKRQKYCSKTCTSREMTRAKRHRDEQTLTLRAKKGVKQHGPKTKR